MIKALLGVVVLSLLAQDAPFNGKDLTGWKPKNAEKSKWKVGKASIDPADNKKLLIAEGAELVNVAAKHGDSVDLFTEAKWGDCQIEVELMVPKGSNSGVYVMGEYEVQVLDSFGKERVGAGDMGGLYNAAAPKVNACKAPGEWQKFVIDFRAPKFDAEGKKTANAKFLKIELNGQVVQENAEMKGPTPGGLTGKEAATGPLMFQGDHGAVAYRGIKITPVK